MSSPERDFQDEIWNRVFPVWHMLPSGDLKQAVQDEYRRISNLTFEINYGEALQSALRIFKLIPEEPSSMVGAAEEYEEAMKAQDLMHGR